MASPWEAGDSSAGESWGAWCCRWLQDVEPMRHREAEVVEGNEPADADAQPHDATDQRGRGRSGCQCSRRLSVAIWGAVGRGFGPSPQRWRRGPAGRMP